MPVPFTALPDETSGLTMFLDEQREALLRKLDGITDDQAKTRSTPSDFCRLTLVKHAAFVERRWMQLEVGGHRRLHRRLTVDQLSTRLRAKPR